MCAPESKGHPTVPGFREVFRAYEVCRRRKRSRPDAIRFEMRALDETWALTSRIASGRYSPSRSVCFVARGAKPREVYAAAFRDRVVHHLLVSALEPFFERRFIADSFACRRHKGTHKATSRLSRFLRAATDNGRVRAYALKLDIRNFFPTIDKNVLWGVVERRTRRFRHPYRDTVLGLLRTVVFHDPTKAFFLACPESELARVPPHKRLGAFGPDRGLPIGNLTSQFLANCLLDELDQYVKRTLKVRWYLRYVDDMILVSRDPDSLRAWAVQIERFLRDHLHLELNQDATRLFPVSRGVDCLGYVVRPHYTLVRRRVVGHLRARLTALGHRLLKTDGRILQCNVAAAREAGLVSSLNSYLGHFRHARTANTLAGVMADYPWVRWFVEFRMDRKGHRVAQDRFAPPRSFRCLRDQWSFFRFVLQGHELLPPGERPVLFVRIGRFYEMFEEDAAFGVGVLGLRDLEPRKGFRRRCGFRKDRLDVFVGKAVEVGRVVAVVEETGRPLGRVQQRFLDSIYRRFDHEEDLLGIAGIVRRVGAGHPGR